MRASTCHCSEKINIGSMYGPTSWVESSSNRSSPFSEGFRWGRALWVQFQPFLNIRCGFTRLFWSKYLAKGGWSEGGGARSPPKKKKSPEGIWGKFLAAAAGGCFGEVKLQLKGATCWGYTGSQRTTVSHWSFFSCTSDMIISLYYYYI